MVAPQVKRTCSKMLREKHGISERRAYQLVGANKSSMRYRSQKVPEERLKEEIKEIALKNRRVHLMLRRKGKEVNHNRVYRIYKELKLKVQKREKRKRILGEREVEYLISKVN